MLRGKEKIGDKEEENKERWKVRVLKGRERRRKRERKGHEVKWRKSIVHRTKEREEG